MTQERISSAALTYIANEMRAMIDDSFHGPRLRTLVPEALDQAASRLSEMEAENKRLREALKPFAVQTRVNSLTEERMILAARAALEQQQKGEEL